MGLIQAIISGVGAIISGVVVKVVADDAKEWTPWFTQRLLDIAVRRLSEGQRERYAEEWAAHLAEVPGVVGKLALSLQFQIAAFVAREADAKARLDAWLYQKTVAAIIRRTIVIEAITRVKAAARGGEDTDETIDRVLRDAIIDISQRCTVGKMPALGVTVTGGIFLVQDLIEKAKGALLVEIGAICWGRDWLANKVLRHLGKTAAK